MAMAPVLAGKVPRSLVIPMYEEVGRIETTLATLAGSELMHDLELVLVDDGSRDGTARIARRMTSRLGLTRVQVIESAANYGKGAAVRTGMLAARGASRVFVDADLSVSLRDIERCFAALEDGAADVAYATRAHPDSALRRGQPALRVLSGRTFNLLLRRLGLTAELDTQCGLKGFRAAAAIAIFEPLVTARFAFDVEVLARATRSGFRVSPIPVTWSHVEASRVRPLRDGLDMARAALSIRRQLAREARRDVVELRSRAGLATRARAARR
jgi:dolichyl-phosphate beta-glucosyltransferase